LSLVEFHSHVLLGLSLLLQRIRTTETWKIWKSWFGMRTEHLRISRLTSSWYLPGKSARSTVAVPSLCGLRVCHAPQFICWLCRYINCLLLMHVCFCCVCFSFSVLSQEIGWEERHRNDLFSVRWNTKPQLNQSTYWLLWV